MAIITSVCIGVVIRIVYDFVIKPKLKKEESHLKTKHIKTLLKNAKNSPEDLRDLLKCMKDDKDIVHKLYYEKLKEFDKNSWDKAEIKQIQHLLKEIKKSFKE